MKYFVFLYFMILLPSAGMPITVEELGRLAELKTSDELILQIIEKDNLQKPISANDVIYLKERGLSENIIDLLWKQSFQDKNFLPPQEGESEMIGENLRLYYTTDQQGKKIAILTNLDESGRRMGPPPPPKPEVPTRPMYEAEPVPVPEMYQAPEPELPPQSAYIQDFAPDYYPVQPPYVYPDYYPVYYTLSSFFPRKHSRHFDKNCFTPRNHSGSFKSGSWHANRILPQASYKANVHGPVIWPGDRFNAGQRKR